MITVILSAHHFVLQVAVNNVLVVVVTWDVELHVKDIVILYVLIVVAVIVIMDVVTTAV